DPHPAAADCRRREFARRHRPVVGDVRNLRKRRKSCMNAAKDKPRHFLDLSDFDSATLNGIIAAARARKDRRGRRPAGEPDGDAPLKDRVLALVFAQPSTRTRISFDLAMQQLGGRSMMLTGTEMQLGRGETVGDTARVLSRYVDAVMIRTLDHEM